MFIKANEVTQNKKFVMIVSGPPGIGKTTMALSAPNPILIDLDKGRERVKPQHRKEAIVVQSYDELLQDINSEEFKQFDTVVIDTGGSLVTYMQDYIKNSDAKYRQKDGSISLKGFGAVKQAFTDLTNQLNTLSNKNVIYVFHTVEEKDKDGNAVQRLMCEGAARNLVWQPCDFGCYMYMQGDSRMLGFTPTETYFAKGCHGITGIRKLPTLTDKISNDYLTRMFEEANANIASETEFFKIGKEAYDKAISAGFALVEAVKTIDDIKAFGDNFKSITHALTSEREIRAMFSEKVKSLGYKWNGKEWAKIEA